VTETIKVVDRRLNTPPINHDHGPCNPIHLRALPCGTLQTARLAPRTAWRRLRSPPVQPRRGDHRVAAAGVAAGEMVASVTRCSCFPAALAGC
jgi:hypothetical protein